MSHQFAAAARERVQPAAASLGTTRPAGFMCAQVTQALRPEHRGKFPWLLLNMQTAPRTACLNALAASRDALRTGCSARDGSYMTTVLVEIPNRRSGAMAASAGTRTYG